MEQSDARLDPLQLRVRNTNRIQLAAACGFCGFRHEKYGLLREDGDPRTGRRMKHAPA
jgi:hypothetical protein